MTLESKVSGLFFGKAKERWAGRPPSAIAKFPAVGPHQLIETGFVTDEQADLRVHGGPDKAVHHYPSEHYSKWQSKRFDTSFAFKPGGFGENISTLGMTEKNVCLGDVFALGSAVVQVSQGRQPCWKLNMHTLVDEMAMQVQKTGKTGWYYRVLQQGEVQVGDAIKLVDRLYEQWPLERLIAARFDKSIKREDAHELSEIDELAANWRQYFYKRANGAGMEDQAARLVG
jgi:MOSC domain-containing protein YiiM